MGLGIHPTTPGGLSSQCVRRAVRVAQWIARLPPKQKVVGSNPTSDVAFCFVRGSKSPTCLSPLLGTFFSVLFEVARLTQSVE